MNGWVLLFVLLLVFLIVLVVAVAWSCWPGVESRHCPPLRPPTETCWNEPYLFKDNHDKHNKQDDTSKHSSKVSSRTSSKKQRSRKEESLRNYSFIKCDKHSKLSPEAVHLRVLRKDATHLEFAVLADSKYEIVDIWLDVQFNDPSLLPIDQKGCLDADAFVYQSHQVALNPAIFLVDTPESAVVYFALKIRLDCTDEKKDGKAPETLTLARGQLPKTCSLTGCDESGHQNECPLTIHSLALCIPKRVPYQNVTGDVLNIVSTPDSTNTFVVGTVPPGVIVQQIDSILYQDIAGSNIKFIHVTLGHNIQGYIQLEQWIVPGTTIPFMVYSPQAVGLQQQLEKVIPAPISTLPNNCSTCLQAPIDPPRNQPVLGNCTSCCNAAFFPCYYAEASQAAGTYCFWYPNVCRNNCDDVATESCNANPQCDCQF